MIIYMNEIIGLYGKYLINYNTWRGETKQKTFIYDVGKKKECEQGVIFFSYDGEKTKGDQGF